MFELDKQKFGKFITQLRKEKGYTQKELAAQLFISDKAVSKWETGVSIPDTALLIPLSDLLEVSVTELLMCRKIADGDTLENDKVESIVKTAIAYSDKKPERAYRTKSKGGVLYGFSLIICCIGTYINYVTAQPCLETLVTIQIISAAFGAYFCFFVKTALPKFYDEAPVGIYYDGPVRMNMPGLKFNNNNWPYIVKASRIWTCISMMGFPIFAFIAGSLGLKQWDTVGNYVLLAGFFAAFFIPMYIAGKKYA